MCQELRRLDLEAALLTDPRHVLYLSGYKTRPVHCSCLLLTREGESLLVAAVEEAELAVEQVYLYDAQPLFSLRPDQPLHLARRVREVAGTRFSRVGLEKGHCNLGLAALFKGVENLEPALVRLRRRKESDELALLRKGIEVAQAAYGRAREVLRPGVSELEVFCELRKAAVLAAGEELGAFGNDFQCGTPGGPPRPRAVPGNELYILDLGPEIGGYHADLCRTFSVDGQPTSLQRRAWAACVEALGWVEERAGPGVSCRELFDGVKGKLDAFLPGAFFHHLGHGVGLSPHEAPYLNPQWNHFLEPGDVFTVEPGVYGEELRGGVRLEENFLVRASAVERLSSFPLEL